MLCGSRSKRRTCAKVAGASCLTIVGGDDGGGEGVVGRGKHTALR